MINVDLNELAKLPPLDHAGQETTGSLTIHTAEDKGGRDTQEDRHFITAITPSNSEDIPALLINAFKTVGKKANVESLHIFEERKKPAQKACDDKASETGAWEHQLQHTTDPNRRAELEDKILEGDKELRELEYATHTATTGSTATVAVLQPDRKLTIAHIGDSPLVMFVRDHKTGKVTWKELIDAQLPSNPKERVRLEKAGAVVFKDPFGTWRTGVEGTLGINMSRSFGDAPIPGMTSAPVISQIDFATGPLVRDPRDRVFLCMASDGIYHWDLPPSQAFTAYADIIEQAYNAGREKDIPTLVTQHARQTGAMDNISVLFAEIPPQPEQTVALGVLDGHGGHEIAELAAKDLKEILGRSFERGVKEGRAAGDSPLRP